MATYGGKSLDAVLEEIHSPSTVEKELLDDKYPYYRIDVYEDRLITALGKDHYEVHYSEVTCLTLPTNQAALICNCTINFIDDDGKVSYHACGVGSYEITYSKQYSSFQWLNNAGYRVQQCAFKSACKSMQIFGIHDVDDVSSESTPHGKKGKKPRLQEVEEIFVTTGKVEVIKTDTATEKPVYKVIGQRRVGNVMETRQATILFYPNMYKKHIDALNDYIMQCQDGGHHILRAKVSETKTSTETEPKYVFKGFWR